MNWLVVTIIVVAVAMIFGPLMLMQPTARERNQASLRAYAIARGIKVRSLPGKEPHQSPMMMYELPAPSKKTQNSGTFDNDSYDNRSYDSGSYDSDSYDRNFDDDGLAETAPKSGSKGAIAWALERKGFSHGIHFDGVWDWRVAVDLSPEQSEAVKTVLTRLPDSVSEIGVGAGGVYCIWSESGTQAVLDRVVECLQALSDSYQ